MHYEPSAPDQPTNFTIIIPVYNRRSEALACLQRLTVPEARGLQVIVVDDGSEAETLEAVEALARTSGGADIRVIRQENGGPGSARNRGAREAKTEWIVFHDSDDLWLPWALTSLRDVFSHPELDQASILFWPVARFMDESELEELESAPVILRRHATMLDLKLEDRLAMIASCNLAMRRNTFLELGGFVTEVRHSEDTDLLYRANMVGEAWVIAEPTLIGYRVAQPNSQNLTNTSDTVRNQRTLYLLNRNAKGFYPGPPEKVAQALGKSVGYIVRGYFHGGYIRSAYVVYWQGASILLRARMWNDLFKLPLTPLLHYLRPKNYPFRWRRTH